MLSATDAGAGMSPRPPRDSALFPAGMIWIECEQALVVAETPRIQLMLWGILRTSFFLRYRKSVEVAPGFEVVYRYVCNIRDRP